MTSYSKVLERVASTLEWMPGAAQESRRSDAAALRALAKLVDRAEELSAQEFQGQTSGAFPVRRETLLKLIELLAAGFTAAPQPVVGWRDEASPASSDSNLSSDG